VGKERVSIKKEEAASQRIRGVLAPVVTLFKADLTPDSKWFIAHCKWLLSQNCGLAVFGTNSEANSLSMEERATLLDELVAAEVDPWRIMPGTGCCSIMEPVKLTAQAVEHGCAGVLMLPPLLPLSHGPHDQHDEARRHGNSDFRFDG
jgi:4-hydroxy-tetrahydrodipicolinate synthase